MGSPDGYVIPAFAGITVRGSTDWISAFAGMTAASSFHVSQVEPLRTLLAVLKNPRVCDILKPIGDWIPAFAGMARTVGRLGMATKTLLSIEQYAALEERGGVRYELSEGELIVTPSASYFHNETRDEFNARLRPFVKKRKLGGVTSETDVMLAGDTVRRPDVAFISAERLRGIDLRKVPLPLCPDLVIEIVSENDRADDLILKVTQYLAAGTRAVWLLYQTTRLAYRYVPSKLEPEVRSVDAGHTFEEPEMLPGLSFPLAEIFPPFEM
jgi:Uma2 family endonuclease